MNVVERISQPSDEAIQSLFEKICSEHTRTIRRVARQFVSDASVMDVEQEALLLAYRKLGQLRDPAAIRGWLATLTRRVAIHYLRKKGRALGDVEADDETKSVAADAEASTVFTAWREKIENQSLLRKLSGAIPHEDLQILLLLYIEDRSVREVSVQLGLSELNLRVRSHRARNRLLKAFQSGDIE